jgi:Xaa-Pro dipeptidase
VLQNADLFYFTGSIQQGALYVPVTGEPLYVVRREYTRARMESELKEIVPIKTHRDIPAILNDFNYPLPQKAGMELDVLPVNLFSRFTKNTGGLHFFGCRPPDSLHQGCQVRL